MKNKKVQILLSTYNGENFLKEQLDSLLKQDYSNIGISIRDDGSSDNTFSILKLYEHNQKIDNITSGRNVGVVESFLKLLKNSDSESDYYAFCDQDDVWLNFKISRAIEKLSELEETVANMYCSQKTIVDEKLNKVGKNNGFNKVLPSFENALVENIATGCTIVINKTTRDLLVKHLPKKIIMHDWWIYIVTSAFGNVIYDSKSYILYRQHQSNVVGVSTSSISKWKKRIKRFKNNKSKELLKAQVCEISNIYLKELSLDKKKILEGFINIPSNFLARVNYVYKSPVYRQNWLDNLALKILILIGKI